MNAQEALKKASKNLHTNVPQKQYDAIMRRIEHYVSYGEFKIHEEYLHKGVKEMFENEGYKVKRSFLFGGYNISWKHLKY